MNNTGGMDKGESIKETLGTMGKECKDCKHYGLVIEGEKLCYATGYECFAGNTTCRYFERGEENGSRTN